MTRPRPRAGGGTSRTMAQRPRSDRRPAPRVAAMRLLPFALLPALLAACGGVAAPPASEPAPTVTPATRPPPTEPTAVAEPCADGRLTVGDLAAVDAEREAGIAAAEERAKRWRADARLVSLRVACQPLEPAFRWQGRFYSDAAQSFFLSDTTETAPAEVEPAGVPTLPRERLRFRELQLVLAQAGHEDADRLSATNGVEVRVNAPTDRFGPPNIPQDIVYHVAIDDQGEVRDLFVSGADWLLYPY